MGNSSFATRGFTSDLLRLRIYRTRIPLQTHKLLKEPDPDAGGFCIL